MKKSPIPQYRKPPCPPPLGDNEEHFIGAWGKGKSCLSFLRVPFLPAPALHHNARNFEEEAFFHLLKV